jgi:glyoxylase-like metal-dependent hydrolase (beta-lactamase superfamily II)
MTDSVMSAVNVYLVRDSDGYVLIDCGLEVTDSREQLHRALGELGVTASAIHTVVVTHGHHDHCGLAQHLSQEHSARIWMHQSDWTYIQRRYGAPDDFRKLQHRWLVRYGMPEDEAVQATRSLGTGGQVVTITQPDRLLAGGETMEVEDLRFEIQWTPGHTPGHVCLLEPTKQLLLSGDHILPNANSNVSLQPYSDVNPLPGYIASLRSLADQPIQLTMPGHGAPMGSVTERAHSIAQHQINRRDQLQSLLTQTPCTPYELGARVWPEGRWEQFTGYLRRNAVGTLIAHLEQLADDGQALRTESDAVRFAARG